MHIPAPSSNGKRTGTLSEDPLPPTNSTVPNTTAVTPNPNPNPNITSSDFTDSRKVGREIQKKCDIMQKIHNQREQLRNNLLKLKQIADKGGIPNAFQTRIKLVNPGVNLPKLLRDEWWKTEREVGKTLLFKAIHINEALLSSTEDNLTKNEKGDHGSSQTPCPQPQEEGAVAPLCATDK